MYKIPDLASGKVTARGVETTKPAGGRAKSNRKGAMMFATHPFASWEIVPRTTVILTGDVHVDGLFVLAAIGLWMILKKR